MFNKQLKQNIKALDKEIGSIVLGMAEVEDETNYAMMVKRVDELTRIRDTMSQNKVNESYSKEIISGLISVGAMALVLKHEKAEIITTKAFSMATKMFRG